jgi:hypothetical protein
MIVKIYDVTDWQELTWLNSGGTRAKRILQSEDGLEWYFKCSEKKPATADNPEKYYKYEFWSEIIAYQLGNFYGLDILKYDVGFYGDQIGCISPKMNISEKEQLVEIGRFMTAENPLFVPDDHKFRKEYSYQLLKETIESFELSEYVPLFFKTVLFDAVIGNTDRHQENWAFICNSTVSERRVAQILKNEMVRQNRRTGAKTVFSGLAEVQDAESLNRVFRKIKLKAIDIIKMAPIYDSGSSLGRELSESKVDVLISNSEQLNKYVSKGLCEIHWEGRKLSHFDFVNKLMETGYAEDLRKAGSFLKMDISTFIIDLLGKIDVDLPDHLSFYRIPESRKQLIYKLLTLRSQKLLELLYGRL